jgi:hypothetical protein
VKGDFMKSYLLLHPVILISLAVVLASLIGLIFLARWVTITTKMKTKTFGSTRNQSLTARRKRLAKNIIFWFSFPTLGFGYLVYLSIRLLLSEMAKQNILVTLRTEGEIKAIMRGNTCVRYIMQVENHKIDPDEFDIFKGSLESYAKFLAKAAQKQRAEDSGFVENKLLTDTNGNLFTDKNGHYQLNQKLTKAIEKANSPGLFEEIFGCPWVGLPPYHVFVYPFRWMKFGQQKAQNGNPSRKVELFPREEEVTSLFHRYTQYGLEVEDVEIGAGSLAVKTDKGNEIVSVQVKATFVFETETVNPQKTLFRTDGLSSAGDWLQALNREIYKRTRSWLGSKETDWDILKQDSEKVEKALLEIRDAINSIDKDGLPLKDAPISSVRDYGQKIITITMPIIDLQDKSLQTASESVFKAERERDANMAKAEGNRALAAAPHLAETDGLRAAAEIPGALDVLRAKYIGNIGVYAPGNDKNLFLNIPTEIAGNSKQKPNKKKGSSQKENEENS